MNYIAAKTSAVGYAAFAITKVGSIIVEFRTIAAIIEAAALTTVTMAFIVRGLCSVKVVESGSDLRAKDSAWSLFWAGCYFACLISLSTFSIDSESLGSKTRS